MSFKDEYGFDAFCNRLVEQWPELALSFRRNANKLFVTASALGATEIASSRTDEAAGTVVRRAVTGLQVKLATKSAVVTAAAAGLAARVDIRVNRIGEIEDALDDLRGELEQIASNLSDVAAGYSDAFAVDITNWAARIPVVNQLIATLTAELTALEGDEEEEDLEDPYADDEEEEEENNSYDRCACDYCR